MLARILQALGWSVLFGFAAGACTSVVATIAGALWGPVFYTDFGAVQYLGFALLYGIGGAVIIGAALFVSYLALLRDQPARQTLFLLAVFAFAVQCLELGIVEAFAIREPNSLSWPIAEQLMPFNIGLFEPVGIWQGRPDAAFFWFSTALAVFVFALGRRPRATSQAR